MAAPSDEQTDSRGDSGSGLSPLAYKEVDGAKYPPYVPPHHKVLEFTLRAVGLGILISMFRNRDSVDVEEMSLLRW